MRTFISVAHKKTLSRSFVSRIQKAVSKTVSSIPSTHKKKLLGSPKKLEISVAVVGTQTMRCLNRKYRKKDKPTDVLSFSLLDNPFPQPFSGSLGELIICLPIAKKQAKEYGETLGRELERLAVHGTLHLFGYDHEKSKKGERIMFALQDKILRTLSPKHLKT